MLFTVYCTTNLINGKVYVGTHKTVFAEDDYLGSGTSLRRAVAKYGRENFRKEIIAVFDNATEMFDMEAEIVNETFVSRRDTYNLKVGGSGGWDRTAYEGRLKKLLEDSEYRMRHCENARQGALISQEMGVGIHALTFEERRAWAAIATQKALAPEAKAKRIESFAAIDHQRGSKNSQFGTCWLKNNSTGEVKKVKKELADELLQRGWVRGR